MGQGDPRFTLLESIREYAGEQLEACGERTSARWAHARYFLSLVEHRTRQLSPVAAMRALEPDLPNICLAVEWLRDERDYLSALRLALALVECVVELRLGDWARLDWSGGGTPTAAHLALLAALDSLLSSAAPTAESNWPHGDRGANGAGPAAARDSLEDPALLRLVVRALATRASVTQWYDFDWTAARQRAERAYRLAGALHDDMGRARASYALAIVHQYAGAGDAAASLAAARDALVIYRRLGHVPASSVRCGSAATRSACWATWRLAEPL